MCTSLNSRVLADNYRRRGLILPDDWAERDEIPIDPLNEREVEMMRQLEEVNQENKELRYDRLSLQMERMEDRHNQLLEAVNELRQEIKRLTGGPQPPTTSAKVTPLNKKGGLDL